jgi:cysteine-rich repeat protein
MAPTARPSSPVPAIRSVDRRLIRAGVALLWIGLASCVSSGNSTCPGSDAFCPEGTACKEIAVWGPNGTSPVEPLCVPEADVAACNGLADGEPCTAIEGAGQCHSGACFAPECGNHVLDVGEACDDADEELGDGCSQACTSDESCGNGVIDPVIDLGAGPVVNERCDDNDVAPHDGCSSTCDLEAPRWRQITIQAPARRATGAMVFDSNRARFVMFGGRSNGLSNDELAVGKLFPCVTDAGDCVAWTPIDLQIRPPMRGDHAMVYDRRRDRVVVFGGLLSAQSNNTILGDHWEWDGRSWTQITALANPGPRFGSAMSYDPIHMVSVLYGGTQLSVPAGGDTRTFEWNGETWSLGGPGPVDITQHAMAFDHARGVTVLVGLFGNALVTWEYDAGTHSWADVTPAVLPRPRNKPHLVWDAVKQQVMMFGGEITVDPFVLKDVWHWNGSAWVETQASFPGDLVDVLVAPAPELGRVVTFGGLDKTGLANQGTVLWDGENWSRELTTVLPTRLFSNHSAAYDAVRDRIVLLQESETWELQDDTWIPAGPNVPVAREAAMTYDAGAGETLLFGGFGGGFRSNATWSWNGAIWAPKQVMGPVPSARNQAQMVYDVENQRVVMFGGTIDDAGNSSEETWVWKDGSWQDITSTAAAEPGQPRGRAKHAMAYDPVRREIVMFGGDALDPMWLFDTRTSKWRRGPAGGPQPRDDSALAWNNARRTVILFGGAVAFGSPLADTWEWDGTQWSPLDVAQAPSGRAGHTMVSSTHGVVVVGGANEIDAWELRWESTQPDDPCRDRRDVDRDGALGCDDGDCRASCSPLCVSQPTDLPGPTFVCDASGSSCGDGTCDPLETCRLCPEDCSCAVVCGDQFCDPGETIATCAGDCTHVCGDGTCDLDETPATCPGDCP